MLIESTAQSNPNDTHPQGWLVGGGEMGELIRSMDWANTPLGPIESWPHGLRTTVNLCLASNFPINIVWGPGHVQIYNDGYRVVVADKHPAAMGMDYAECWASAWPAIGGPFERAWLGETSFLENQRMFLQRNGYMEETFFTFSLSPIRDETGRVAGLFHPVTETTSKMLSERRTRALRDLATQTSEARTTEDALSLAAKTLMEYQLDLPLVLLYRLDDGGHQALLIGSTGIEPGTPASPKLIDLDDGDSCWPIGQIVRATSTVEIDDVPRRFRSLSCGPYPEPPKMALAWPIVPAGAECPVGIIIVGTSPRLPLNEGYRSFCEQLAHAITTIVSNARAYEQERRRAEALAEIDRAKTEFFSNVSHEFRTPLTLILSPLEELLAQDRAATQDAQNELQLIHRNALRLLKLVNTLLDFSRIEAGRARAVYEPLDLGELTANLASAFRSATERAGLRLVVDCPPVPQPVYVDREMWEKIVFNLLSNAFKFTFEGEISIALKTVQDQVELTVQDTGIGIDEKELPRVCERFHRIQGTRARTHEGTGIGLALVQEFVHLHGGSISVSSQLGHGSTFLVTVPLGKSHLPPDQINAVRNLASTAIVARSFVEEALRWIPGAETNSASVSAARHEQPDSRSATSTLGGGNPENGRILLADDNADMRGYIRGLLAQRYEVITVADGEAAVAAARESSVDLVLTDVMMPRLDGFGLLRALRQDSLTSTIPVILLSARAGEESRVEGLEAGADDYLVKPFTARELLAHVDAHLRLAKMRKEAAALHESELRFRSMADCVPVMMWTCGTERLCDYFNQGWLDFTGRSEEQEANDGWRAGIHPDDLPQLLAQFDSAFAARRTFSLEYRLRRHDGHYRWVLGIAAPRLLPNGTFLGYIMSCIDISERREAEKQVRELNENLEARVVERTAQLTTANQDLEAFSYSVSHDLRAPLRHINGFAAILAQEHGQQLDQPGQECLKSISEAATRMGQLIDGLLEMGRLDRQQISRKLTDLNPLVQEVIRELEELWNGRDLEWRIGALPILECDPSLIKCVFTNLLSNAIKYTRRKQRAIIEVGHQIVGGKAVLFIRDNGAGFDQRYAGKLFGVFQRLHKMEEFEGTGIGLATVQRIIQRHGGRVWAEAEIDKGATFSFYCRAV